MQKNHVKILMELVWPNLLKYKYAVQLDAVSAEEKTAVIDLEEKKNVVLTKFQKRKYVDKQVKKPHVIWNRYRKQVSSSKLILELWRCPNDNLWALGNVIEQNLCFR